MSQAPFPKAPGHTCPQIDKAQRALRRMAWRAHRSKAEDGLELPEDDIGREVALRQDEVALILRDGIRALEEVRAENSAMRSAHSAAAAYASAASAVVAAAQALAQSGYDGPFSGDVVAPLLQAVAAFERSTKVSS